MASNYDFRVLIETVSGSEHSFGTASFVTLATNTSQVLNTSDVVDRINTLKSITYFNGQTHETASSLYDVRTVNKFSGSTGTDTNYQFLSASMKGGPDSGSIIFHANSTPTAGGDFIKRYKFFGNKVCNVLGVPENYWIYADKFRLTNTGSESNYISGDILGQSIHLRDNFAISNAGSITSDLPMKHAENTDRWIKWQNVSGSLPQNDMLIGYGNQSNKYMIRMQNNNDLIISSSGVDFTGDIDATGDATFGTITMAGKIDTSGEVEAEHLHSTDDIELGDAIFHSGDSDTRMRFGTNQIIFDAGSTTLEKMRITSTGVVINEDAQDYDFRVESNGNTNILFVDGGNNRIGIGTGSPLNKFQINHPGSDGDNGLMLVRSDASVSDGDLLGGIGFDSTDGNVPSSVLEASAFIAAKAAEDHTTGDKGGDLIFGTSKINDDDDTTSTEHMRITDDGDIGIGTDSPQSQLHIEHTDDTTNAVTNTFSDYLLTLKNNSNVQNAFAGIAFDCSSETETDSIGAAIKAVNDNTTSTLHDANLTFHTNDAGDSGNTERMRITHDGNVAIGQTAASEKLEVNGNIKVDGYILHEAAESPCFSAFLSSDETTVVANSFTTVVFDSEDYDLGSDYNTSTGVFTAPTDGIYWFHFNLTMVSQIDNVIDFTIRLLSSNGESYAYATDINEGQFEDSATIEPHTFAVSAQIKLDAGQNVRAQYFSGTNNGDIDSESTHDGQTVNRITYFQGNLVRAL